MVGAAQDATGGRGPFGGATSHTRRGDQDRLVGAQLQDLLDQGGDVAAGPGRVGGGAQPAVKASQ